MKRFSENVREAVESVFVLFVSYNSKHKDDRCGNSSWYVRHGESSTFSFFLHFTCILACCGALTCAYQVWLSRSVDDPTSVCPFSRLRGMGQHSNCHDPWLNYSDRCSAVGFLFVKLGHQNFDWYECVLDLFLRSCSASLVDLELRWHVSHNSVNLLVRRKPESEGFSDVHQGFGFSIKSVLISSTSFCWVSCQIIVLLWRPNSGHFVALNF